MNNYLSFENSVENRIFANEFTKQYQLKEKSMGVIEIIREELRREALEKAEEKGMEKGMERGVLNAAQKGMPNADIAYYFDITIEEVVRILSAKK